MRFKLHAYPRLMGQAKGTFDAISTYKLDREGKIYEHSVDNMQLRDPPITNPLLYGLNLLVGPQASPQQVPCPGERAAGLAACQATLSAEWAHIHKSGGG